MIIHIEKIDNNKILLLVKNNNELKIDIININSIANGGDGSGNWGHEGREGEVGGSGKGGGMDELMKKGKELEEKYKQGLFTNTSLMSKEEKEIYDQYSKIIYEESEKREKERIEKILKEEIKN